MGVAAEVVVLAGGTGGAKLARGMQDVVGAERLAVVANTGDDIEMYGAHVSPDPDLVSFWLADAIDERGWKRFRLAMAVDCPNISKPKFVENSIGSNCCSSRSRLWRPSGTRCSTQNKPKRRPRRRCCWVSVALGRSSLRSSGLKDSPDTSITADRSPLMPALPRRLGKAGRSIASRASRNRATGDYGPR